MKKLFSIILLSALFACQAQDNQVSKMNANDFEKSITADKVQVFDVRTMAEFQSGHIANALQADWNNKAQFVERIGFLDKNKPVYVYCLAGARSESAAVYLRKNGFKNVIELEGGINAWKRYGKSLEDASNEKQYSIEEYNALIPKDKTVLVNFGADWCPPCVKMKPVLNEIINDPAIEISLIKIDAGIHTDIMNTLNIEGIPVYLLYKNGQQVWRKDGIFEKSELLSILK
jgi:rhodanese-related sulfurtransferase